MQLLEEPAIEPETPFEQQDWATRQNISSQKWEEARLQLLDNYLKSEMCLPRLCQHCHNGEAVIKCRDCLPLPYFYATWSAIANMSCTIGAPWMAFTPPYHHPLSSNKLGKRSLTSIIASSASYVMQLLCLSYDYNF